MLEKCLVNHKFFSELNIYIYLFKKILSYFKDFLRSIEKLQFIKYSIGKFDNKNIFNNTVSIHDQQILVLLKLVIPKSYCKLYRYTYIIVNVLKK